MYISGYISLDIAFNDRLYWELRSNCFFIRMISYADEGEGLG
jgi:hypothetical protein